MAVVYLKHRFSKDLDFFSDSPFSSDQINSFAKDLKEELRLDKVEGRRIFDRYEFFIHNQDWVRLEFVFFDHPRLKPRKRWQGIEVDSLEDIAANKTLALFDRNEPKDLCDLYFLLERKEYRVGQLLKMVEKKFGIVFPESGFWSEVAKVVSDLKSLKPFLLGTKTGQEKLLKEIEDYFITSSTAFLHRLIG